MHYKLKKILKSNLIYTVVQSDKWDSKRINIQVFWVWLPWFQAVPNGFSVPEEGLWGKRWGMDCHPDLPVGLCPEGAELLNSPLLGVQRKEHQEAEVKWIQWLNPRDGTILTVKKEGNFWCCFQGKRHTVKKSLKSRNFLVDYFVIVSLYKITRLADQNTTEEA